MHGIQPGVAVHHGAGQCDVATGDGIDGVSHLGLGEPPHTGDFGRELIQLVAVGLDGVQWHSRDPSRNGR